ncbi:hypothetical protein J537_0913 [Acinetobacter baumannii 1437282]|nr:hypothetical protein J537_0913 [Acinetobacter baumannii 1437282]
MFTKSKTLSNGADEGKPCRKDKASDGKAIILLCLLRLVIIWHF